MPCGSRARTATRRGPTAARLVADALAGGDAHAGHTETSLMLALHPELVAAERARPGDVRPLTAIAGDLRRGGVRAVSPDGVLGDPTGANAEAGAANPRPVDRQLVTSVAAALAGCGCRPWIVTRRYVLDASTRQLGDDGRIVLGGSPLRLFRLTHAGAAAFAAVVAATPSHRRR